MHSCDVYQFFNVGISSLVNITLNVKNQRFSSMLIFTTQQTNICSKSTIETLEKGVKYVQSYQKDVCDILVPLLLTLNIVHSFF